MASPGPIVSIVDRIAWLVAVAEEPGMLVSSYRVAIELANFKNSRDGRCDPSLATLARKLKIEKRSVRRAVRQLEERGFLDSLPSTGGTRASTHQFWFTYPQRGTGRSSLEDRGGPDSPPREDRSCPGGGTGRSSKHSKEPVIEPGGWRGRERAPGGAGRLFVNGRFLDEDR